MPERSRTAPTASAAGGTAGAVGQHPDTEGRNRAISDTALITLGAYAVCGIPLAKEFMAAATKGAALKDKSWLTPGGSGSIDPMATTLLRARYLGSERLVRNLVAAGRIEAVVERAAGIYPLGFNITRDLSINYLETDISADFALKPQICGEVAMGLGIEPRGRLLFTRMDAITLEGIGSVSELLRGGNRPLCIIDAGLMIYQPEDLFEAYVEAGKRLLALRKDSIWVATDMSFRTRGFVEAIIGYVPHFRDYFDRINAGLGVDYRKFFPDTERQVRFLERKGLTVEGYSPTALGYELRFDGMEKSALPPQTIQAYLGYLNGNFRTTVLRLRR